MTTHSQRALILYRRRCFINHLLTYLLTSGCYWKQNVSDIKARPVHCSASEWRHFWTHPQLLTISSDHKNWWWYLETNQELSCWQTNRHGWKQYHLAALSLRGWKSSLCGWKSISICYRVFTIKTSRYDGQVYQWRWNLFQQVRQIVNHQLWAACFIMLSHLKQVEHYYPAIACASFYIRKITIFNENYHLKFINLSCPTAVAACS